jgi:hypothetical protein
VVAPDEAQARTLRESLLLTTLAGAMHTRVDTRTERGNAAPPGMPVLTTGTGSAEAVRWHLEHGAEQLLCTPVAASVPAHVVIFAPDADARRSTFAVAASLLRHIPAEATYVTIQDADMPEPGRAASLRQLLDARSAAMTEHGLDMRTEVRFGDVSAELLRELLAHENTMLVLGIRVTDRTDAAWLAHLLEGPVQRPVLIVRAPGDDPTAES